MSDLCDCEVLEPEVCSCGHDRFKLYICSDSKLRHNGRMQYVICEKCGKDSDFGGW
jgi:hypothetical protein